MPDLIVTGIPRGGTTLAAALIDSLPDTVCLNEPLWHNAKAAADAKGFAGFIARDFTALRARLLKGESVSDRRGKGGEATTNYFRVEGGRMQHSFDIVPFSRAGLTPDFTLAIKHNGPYLAVLPELIALERFSITAIIRHPVPVIHSWRSLQLPISEGKMPNAAPYWPELAAAIAAPMDLLAKQVRLYDLMCARLWECREHLRLIPYEALIQTPGLLGPVDASRVQPQKPVPEAAQAEIAAAMRAHGTHYRTFYPDL